MMLPTMLRAVALMSMLGLGACANAGKTTESGELLTLAPVSSETLTVDYQRLAECAYGRLDQPGIRKADFPTTRTVKIGLDSGAIRYWEISVIGVGPNRARVDLAAVRTMWGADTASARDVMPAVRACAT